jgi:hypothetical protein
LALISNRQLPRRAGKQQSTVNSQLLTIFKGFPGARDIQSDLKKLLQQWNYTEETLYKQTRKIHAKCEVYRKKKAFKKMIGFKKVKNQQL